ncbi:MAG: hypothetical protein HYX38_20035 [Rhodospirillales bacterium]|nr:hypothetical protein [Rhodospirillales bacterium]
MPRSILVGAWSVLIGVSLVGQPAAAEEAREAAAPAANDPDPWRFEAAAYGWLMSAAGSTTAKGRTVDFDASFIQLLQKSDSLIGYMGYFEADKGRIGFYADLVFARLGFTNTMLNDRNPVAGLKVSTTANAALTYSMTIVETGGLYELHRWSGSEGSSTALDALLGFRIWNQAVDVNYDVIGAVDLSRLGFQRGIGFSTTGSGSLTWIDPLVGLRLRHQLTPAQKVTLRGDIGGFGLQSSITWQAAALYSYAWQFTGYQLVAGIGYRALGVNYATGSGNAVSAIDMVLHGPIVGAAIRF